MVRVFPLGGVNIEQTIADKIQRIDDLPKAQEVYYQLTPVLGRYSMITVEGDQW